MLYDYQYDIAGLAATLFLLAIYLLRRNYRTKSNIILLLLMICNCIGCVGDIVSCFTISYPDRFPMGLNYISNMAYLYFYNSMAVLFFLFVDSKAKIEAMMKKSIVLAIVISAVEFILIVTTPFTELVFYFDENGMYHRGILMNVLYGTAAVVLVLGVILFNMGRKRFNRYQLIAISSFIVVIIFCVSFQIVFPRYLIGQMGCALVLFFLYTAFENPVYFTYKDSRCFNRRTFLEVMKVGFRAKKKYAIVAFAIHDYNYIKRGMSIKDTERLSSRIAEFFYRTFGDEGFCIADDKFLVVMDSEKKDVEAYKDVILDKVSEYVSTPIMLIDSEQKISMNHWYLTGIDYSLSEDDVIDSLDNLMEKEADSLEDIYNIKDLIAQVNRRQKIVHILSRAVQNSSFDVYYQPIFDVSKNAFTSVEALVRLTDMELGFISPEEFIPIAEKSGLIYAIGEIVFRKVCCTMKEQKLREMGISYVEINLSPLQCFQEDLVPVFLGIMKEYDIDPSYINLEITETANFKENSVMMTNIEMFHDYGTTFSLDDYGSGFASIDYLFKLPVDIVKIDKSILWQAVKDENAMIALTSTMRMLKDLGKHIVVEGVETKDMVDILLKNDCDYMQGYYYSKPLPEAEYISFIKTVLK